MEPIIMPPSPTRTTNASCPDAPFKPRFECSELGCTFSCKTPVVAHLHKRRHQLRRESASYGGGDPCVCGQPHQDFCKQHPGENWGAQPGGSPPDSPKSE